ncbi:lysylphosphatidylglycerol synthase transmembrane domain-containing protein [Streptantibioticus silvisoli]|uniref:Lysylphosphatidylglycerol synthase transmembrane domain-containing protein n=1 Tax=Streptantibioticus silvisoli TaxID=2705255 RepID=A0ABT6VZL2_9ACTN|nr:lysylphosphatidylglycerol synthase transmembrane domain-containing protein [Streptantibioticus silvisoli]MDI5963864.1 lysylphosphatidylglycerol synthase transmembrane domain-containing protein [Streptantibioticus silvisoli]
MAKVVRDAAAVSRPPSGAHPAVEPGIEHTEEVAGDEPLLAARVHRPADLLRFLTGVLGLVVVLAIAMFAHGTTNGVEQDIARGTQGAPDFLITFAGFTASVAVLIVPVAFAVERLIKRDGLRVADGVLAAVLAHGLSLATDLWVTDAAPGTIRDALTTTAPSGGITDPVHGYLAPVIAYMTAVGMSRRPRWRVALWCVLLLDAFAVLVGGYTTPFSIVVTLLIGWTVAYATVYAVGSPNVRPTGQTLLAGLRRVGFSPVTAQRFDDAPDTADSERGRRYLVTLTDGPPLDITVVDREQQAHGFFYRFWRRLQLRGVTERRSLQSLRQALEQEALLAYAAISAGAHAPKLIATSELGPDAVMLVYEHIDGRSLDGLEDEEITGEVMDRAWQQVRSLQSRRIAHRRLVGESLLVDRDGTLYVTDLRSGEIAAGDIVLRMDVAQLMTTFALRVGPERAVSSAVRVLGPDAVADSLPLLQPIALDRSTRATLRQLAKARSNRERSAVIEATRIRRTVDPQELSADHKVAKAQLKAEKEAEKRAMEDALEAAREEDLLSQIRQQVLQIRPQAPVQPVRLERFKARTLVSYIAGAIAAYFLLSQLTSLKWNQVIGDANWAWVVAALLLSAATYVPATMSLLGFVPEKVPFGRTVLAQVAGNFVKLVAPAAVGGVALNTRFLQRNGVRPGLAVASVGAAQLASLGGHILLLAMFGYLTGTQHAPSLSPSRTVIAGLLTAAVLVLVVTAVPPLRKFVSSRVRSLFAGVVPRMLDMLQRPRKLITGAGGVLLLTLVNVACLDASVRAFGFNSMSYASVAVVFLVANAAGSAVPSPGGVGAIEAALSGALTIAGMGGAEAVSAVLLFRLATFWLPVLPGWLCFTHLTRRGEL